eukprot:scaffold17314_cov19-Tisochrysis_lutea.AAC.1
MEVPVVRAGDRSLAAYYADSGAQIWMHCIAALRPGEDSFSDNQDGIVDVLSTSKWGIRNPLIDALFTSTEYIHGDVLVNEALPSFAWSINFADPGVHKISMVGALT